MNTIQLIMTAVIIVPILLIIVVLVLDLVNDVMYDIKENEKLRQEHIVCRRATNLKLRYERIQREYKTAIYLAKLDKEIAKIESYK